MSETTTQAAQDRLVKAARAIRLTAEDELREPLTETEARLLAAAAIWAVADDLRADALRDAAHAASKLLSTPDGRVGEVRAWTTWLNAYADSLLAGVAS